MSKTGFLTINRSSRLETTTPMSDAKAAALEFCLSILLADAIAYGYVIEVGQRINPLAPRDAVTVATVRRARGNY